MTYRGADLTAELRTLVDAEPPPCTLDLDEARARGLSARRRRRAVGVGGGLTGTCLALLLVLQLLPVAGSAPRPAAPVTSFDPSSAKDPLTTAASFGWLPAGMAVVGADSGSALTARDGAFAVSVTVLGRGRKPPVPCATQDPRNDSTSPPGADLCHPPAPSVEGHPAYWYYAPGGPAKNPLTAELVWEYAADSWATLNVVLPGDSARVQATLYRVAENVRIGPGQPVPMPFHLPAAPRGWQVERVSTFNGPIQGGTLTEAELSYTPRDTGTKQTIEQSLSFDVLGSMATFPSSGQLTAVGQQVPASGVQHVTVNGHEAVLLHDTYKGMPVEVLWVHDMAGVDLNIFALGSSAVAWLDANGGILAYAKTVQVFGADPTRWTTDVIG